MLWVSTSHHFLSEVCQSVVACLSAFVSVNNSPMQCKSQHSTSPLTHSSNHVPLGHNPIYTTFWPYLYLFIYPYPTTHRISTPIVRSYYPPYTKQATHIHQIVIYYFFSSPAFPVDGLHDVRVALFSYVTLCPRDCTTLPQTLVPSVTFTYHFQHGLTYKYRFILSN